MEILKSEQYIGEKLNIQPVSKNRLAEWTNEPAVGDNVKKFIEDHNLKWNKHTKCYDCDESVEIDKNVVSDGVLAIRFGRVKGNFVCKENDLQNLEGSPQEVGGYFDCTHNQLTSLKGSPQKVGGAFCCYGNTLKTLEGAPQEVGGGFFANSTGLESLKGAPQKVGGDFVFAFNSVESFNYLPLEIGGDVHCEYNQLKYFDYVPNKVNGDFYYKNNPNLVLPKRKPNWLHGKFSLS